MPVGAPKGVLPGASDDVAGQESCRSNPRNTAIPGLYHSRELFAGVGTAPVSR